MQCKQTTVQDNARYNTDLYVTSVFSTCLLYSLDLIHSKLLELVVKTLFRAVDPITDPIYREPKDDFDIGVDKISHTSDYILGTLQVLCKEDMRQTL